MRRTSFRNLLDHKTSKIIFPIQKIHQVVRPLAKRTHRHIAQQQSNQRVSDFVLFQEEFAYYLDSSDMNECDK